MEPARPPIDDVDPDAQAALFESLGGPGADPLVAEEKVPDAQDQELRIISAQVRDIPFR
jgi:hypothetical protein